MKIIHWRIIETGETGNSAGPIPAAQAERWLKHSQAANSGMEQWLVDAETESV